MNYKRKVSCLLLLCMIISLLPLQANATVYSGKCGDNLSWRLDTDSRVLTISGTGDMYNWDLVNGPYGANISPWKRTGQSFDTVEVLPGVTSIGEQAFLVCTSVTKVVLPNTISRICNDAFNNCQSLTDINIPEGVISIGSCAFVNTELSNVKIPSTVTSIGSGAFTQCSSLIKISVSSANQLYTSDNLGVLYNKDKTTLLQCPAAFSGKYIIPYGVANIDHYAFTYCTKLTEITIPPSVEFIGREAFAGCTSLSGVLEIPNRVTQLKNGTFKACVSLKEVVLPFGLERIGEYAFSVCTSLESVTIPSSVKQIYEYAFYYNSSLKNVYYKGSEEEWDDIYISTNNAWLTQARIHYNHFGTGANGEPSLDGPLSEEMLHLIFADMAYAHIPLSYNHKDTKITVEQWLYEAPWNGATSELSKKEMEQPIYKNSSISRIDIYGLLGDWTIESVESGKSGYAAVVFKKGDQIIIAYRGSEDGAQSIFAGKDWTVDMQFALFNYLNPDQFEAALNTYSKFEGNGNITLTGHSLGGALTTYVSTLKNVKGYAFDGACGHVVDLTYLQAPLNIDFTDTADMHFTNYTDPPSLSGKIADLIQHTSEDLFPGVCYTSNPDCVDYYGALSWTHQIFSNTRLTADGSSIEFMPVAETHKPTSEAYASVDYELLRGGIRLAGNIVSLFGESTEGYTVKNGNLWLGTAANDSFSVLTALDNPRYITSVVTANVLYGGDGCDTLSGAVTADVLVPNELLGDKLAGKLGSDHYIIDCRYNGSVYITDNSGVDRIYLRNVGDPATVSVKYSQLSNDKEWHIYRVNETTWIHIKSTLFRHEFTVLDEYGVKICTIDTKGSSSVRSTALRAPVSEMAYKEVYVEGESTVRLYDENNNVVGAYSLQESGLYTEDFGTVEVGAREETVYLSATIPESYHARVTGDDPVYVSITGTDTEGHVNRVTHAEDLDLSSGEVEIIPEGHSILQNGTSAATSDATKTVRTEISKTMLSVDVGDSAQLTGKAFFADGISTQDIYWLSSDPSIAKCEYDEKGQCTVTGIASGEATVYAVARDSGVTVECKVTVSSKELVNPFSDVKESDYYYDPVLWAVDKDITSGMGKGKFAPENPCTRGQIVTFLWRACGSPEPTEKTNPFSDVASSAYYYKAVLWAVENGITAGTGKGKFSPEDTCTRGQVATFLWRAQGKPAPASSSNPFSDVNSGAYYYDAILWAVENGITAGTGKGKFSPDASCTRGQIVTFLYRALS